MGESKTILKIWRKASMSCCKGLRRSLKVDAAGVLTIFSPAPLGRRRLFWPLASLLLSQEKENPEKIASFLHTSLRTLT